MYVRKPNLYVSRITLSKCINHYPLTLKSLCNKYLNHSPRPKLTHYYNCYLGKKIYPNNKVHCYIQINKTAETNPYSQQTHHFGFLSPVSLFNTSNKLLAFSWINIKLTGIRRWRWSSSQITNNLSISIIRPLCCFVIAVAFIGSESFTWSRIWALSLIIVPTVERLKSSNFPLFDGIFPFSVKLNYV